MRLNGPKIIFSPTDLSSFFRSPYVSWLGHYNLVATKNEKIEREPDATQTLLAEKGDEFERAELKRQRSIEKLSVIEIAREDSFEIAARKTVEAMGGSLSLVVRFSDREPVVLSGIGVDGPRQDRMAEVQIPMSLGNMSDVSTQSGRIEEGRVSGSS